MKTRHILAPFLIFVLCSGERFAESAESPTQRNSREHESTVARMKEEKQRDEQDAKDFANRVKVARFDSVWRTPRTNDIDVHQVGEKVQRPYKSIALLAFECAAQDETQALAGFIAKAKDLGADGVLVLAVEFPNATQAVSKLFSPADRRVFRANAIVYRTGD